MVGKERRPLSTDDDEPTGAPVYSGRPPLFAHLVGKHIILTTIASMTSWIGNLYAIVACAIVTEAVIGIG